MEPQHKRKILAWLVGGVLAATVLISVYWPFLECPNLANDLRSFDAYDRVTSDSPAMKQKIKNMIHMGCLRCGGSGRISIMRNLFPGDY